VDANLKYADLPNGVDDLATNVIHNITIDSRCFEVAALMSQFNDCLDGMLKLKAGGKTFEQPLRDGHIDDGTISFRFYDLPWGSTGTVTIVFDAVSKDAKPVTLTLLEDVPISGVAVEGETPKGGATKAAGSSAPAASKGKATEGKQQREPKLSFRKGDGSVEELKKS
jgi:hypothetical protein